MRAHTVTTPPPAATVCTSFLLVIHVLVWDNGTPFPESCIDRIADTVGKFESSMKHWRGCVGDLGVFASLGLLAVWNDKASKIPFGMYFELLCIPILRILWTYCLSHLQVFILLVSTRNTNSRYLYPPSQMSLKSLLDT